MCLHSCEQTQVAKLKLVMLRYARDTIFRFEDSVRKTVLASETTELHCIHKGNAGLYKSLNEQERR